MVNEFITYEQAVKLKELEFDENTICVYNSYKQLKGVIASSVDGDSIKRDKWEDRVRAPLKQQVFRWFREKFGYYGEIYVDDDKTFGYHITNFLPLGRVSQPLIRGFNTYEEAELNCIDKLIELIQK